MRASITTSDHRTEISEGSRPEPDAGQLLLQVQASGICGTDLHLLGMLGPGVTLGHEFTGTVAALGDGVDGFEIGERVVALPAIACKQCRACLNGDPVNCRSAKYLGGDLPGSFAEYVVVDAQASVPVPAEVSIEAAALVEPLAVTLKIFERASVRAGDRVLILGAGPIGLGVTMWARASGAGLIAVSDPVETRRQLALHLGATHAVDPAVEDLEQFAAHELDGSPEVVIECAGRPGLFAAATSVVAGGGRVVVAGMHMGTEEFNQRTPFLKNLEVVFSSWYTVRHYRHAVQLLSDGRIDPTPMVTHRITLDEVDQALRELASPNEYGKVLVCT